LGFARVGQGARDAEARVAQGNATALAAALDELQTEIVRIA
jgi:hypothetical protein